MLPCLWRSSSAPRRSLLAHLPLTVSVAAVLAVTIPVASLTAPSASASAPATAASAASNCSASVSGTALSRSGWAASANTPAVQRSDAPANALDGDLSTRYSSDASQAPGQTFEVNLGSPQSFSELEMAVPGSATDYARGYTVEVSSTGSSWTVVASCTGTGTPEVVSFPAQTARYVEVVVTATNTRWWWSIDEFNLYGAGTGATVPPTSTATVPATTTTTAPHPASAPTITAHNGSLYLNGAPYHFSGVNAYEIATDWGVNGGCGVMVSQSQLDGLFSSLPPNSLVRFWAWQGSAVTNINTHQLDWSALDRVFNTAAAFHQRLIVVLTGQSGQCDDGAWKDPSWYSGGYLQVHNSNGLTPLSYWTYLQDVVNRYKNSPALGMWEPISEPEASTCPPQYSPSDCSGHQTCPDEAAAATALRSFFDAVGAEIHSLDPDHLVESGTLGSGQCGTSGPDYAMVSASPGIDVLSYHDYYGATPIGGDQWNGLSVRFQQAASLHKPIIGGEVGIEAGNGSGCVSPATRASEFQSKEQAQLAAGSSGLLVWNWEPTAATGCAYDTYPTDPLMSLVSQGPV